MSTEKKIEIKEILLTGIGLAVGMEIYDYFVKGSMFLPRFAFMILLCLSIIFLFKKVKNR